MVPALRARLMDPRALDPQQWDRIAQSLVSLYAFAGLGLAGACALLLGRAVMPALLDDAGGAARTLRRAPTPLGAIGLALAAVALGRGLILALDVLAALYPRFAV